MIFCDLVCKDVGGCGLCVLGMDRHPDWSSTKRTCAKGPEEIKRKTTFTDDMQLLILKWWSYTFVQHFVETRAIFRRTGRILQQILVNIQSAPTLPFEDANIFPCVFLYSYIFLSDFCILCVCAINTLAD